MRPRVLALITVDTVKAWHSVVSSARRARHLPTAASPSQTSTRGTAPSVAISYHQPAYSSSARRLGTSTADAHRA